MGFNLLKNGPHKVAYYPLPDVLQWFQIANWIALGQYEYYHQLPHDELGLFQATDEASDPMWWPGSVVTDAFLSRIIARARLNLSYENQTWFFSDDKYARIDTSDSDKVLAGPSAVKGNWEALDALGFTTVDAFLPMKGGAWVFPGENYGRIAVNGLDITKASGPNAITAYWASLAKAGLSRVDAALVTPSNANEAWVFHGRLHVRITCERDFLDFERGSHKPDMQYLDATPDAPS
jgi:hypothetical protein